MPQPQDVLAVADSLWRGEVSTARLHPLQPGTGMAEVADGFAFVPSFGNVSAVGTEDGLLLVDTGSALTAGEIHTTLRAWSPSRLHTAIYSHGHIDHVFGMPVWEAESAERGWSRPQVVAHEAVVARFDRYVRTAGYNGVVNRRQFGIDWLVWPTEYRYPDRTYRDRLDLDVGGRRAELHHARGETDDHTWTWFPDSRVLCCGDLFIWASPNAGNPQKVGAAEHVIGAHEPQQRQRTPMQRLGRLAHGLGDLLGGRRGRGSGDHRLHRRRIVGVRRTRALR